MKLQSSEQIPLVRPQIPRKKTSKVLLPLIIALTVLITLIPLYNNYPFFRGPSPPPPSKNNNEESSSSLLGSIITSSHGGSANLNTLSEESSQEEECDLFTGEWVRNSDGPYYTNETCFWIQEHQNCMRFGRPDSDYLKWRWKPDDCELPLLDAYEFLVMMKGKSLAFVGDSVARNHMQSLMCLLSRVAQPVDLSDPQADSKQYTYKDFNFNISIFWSPYLVKSGQLHHSLTTVPFSLYLDRPDPNWTTQIQNSDYVLISAGHWFFRPTYFFLNETLVGCLYCPEQNVTHLPPSFSYRRAFRTALAAINEAQGFKGAAFLRTFAPSHFEGGGWDSGGDCRRTAPLKRKEARVLTDMYTIQLEELRIATAGRKKKIKLFDTTKAMAMRPDGHPSRFGHWPEDSRVMPNDCVHWCLPGPIDAWNDMLQEILRRENEYNRLL